MTSSCCGITIDAMRLMPRAVLLVVLSLCMPAWAQVVQVPLCYNYGCSAHGEVVFASLSLERVHARLLAAPDPPTERTALAAVIGELYGLAAAQTPVGTDRAGNFLDHGVDGRMDCIDHSTNTTLFLAMIEARGMLRFHRVLEPARRMRFIVQHFSAVIEEIEPPAALQPKPEVPDHVPLLLALCDCAEVLGDIPVPVPVVNSRPGERYVIDSWFVDNGEAAIVLPLANWLDGEGPNVQ